MGFAEFFGHTIDTIYANRHWLDLIYVAQQLYNKAADYFGKGSHHSAIRLQSCVRTDRANSTNLKRIAICATLSLIGCMFNNQMGLALGRIFGELIARSLHHA